MAKKFRIRFRNGDSAVLKADSTIMTDGEIVIEKRPLGGSRLLTNYEGVDRATSHVVGSLWGSNFLNSAETCIDAYSYATKVLAGDNVSNQYDTTPVLTGNDNGLVRKSNLDDFKEGGKYFFRNQDGEGTNGYAIYNSPLYPNIWRAGVSGYLEVFEASTSIKQIKQVFYINQGENKNLIYIRTYNEVWSDWAQIKINEDTGWVNFTPTSDFILYNENIPCQYRKNNDFCFITGVLKPVNETVLANGKEAIIYTLPENLRPSHSYIFLAQGSNKSIFTIEIKANGNICFSRYRDSLKEGESYPTTVKTTTWLPFSITYLI